MFGRFEFMTNLQYKAKHLQEEVDAFKSGDKYVEMQSNLRAAYADSDRKIKKLENKLAEAHAETVCVREQWFQVFEDLQAEKQKELTAKDRIIDALNERICKAEIRVGELKAENPELRRARYAIETELEDERGKNQKLIAQISRDHENSSIASSMKPGKKKISNNRVKTGKKPGGQPGHEGHGRKKQVPDNVIHIPPPQEYLNNPDYALTGNIISKQIVRLVVIPQTDEYDTPEFRNKKTGKLFHAAFPDGLVDDVNYDGSVKAFAFMLNNHCNVSIDKTREFMSALTDGALEISKGMINGLSAEFAEKTVSQQAEIFDALTVTPVMNIDFTTARVDGKNMNVAVCADSNVTAYFAREHKGFEGIIGTPAELNPNTLVHDHDMSFYKFGSRHQECSPHILRYALDSMENEKNLTWHAKMRELLREMIHYRNGLGTDDDLDPVFVSGFESRFDEILDLADREYEYEPPTKYYKDGFNLKQRLRKFKDAHTLFLHDKNVPADNNRAERLLRRFKRKQKQVISFRSFDSFVALCQSLTMLDFLHSHSVNFYKSIADIFG